MSMEVNIATNPGQAEVAETPEPQVEEVASPENETETEGQSEGGGFEQEQAQPEDDTDEVEHEGKKYRIPKAVKPLVMMNADYTRKTQSLAEERKAHAAEREQFQQNARFYAETLQDQARLVHVDDQLKQYQALNWQEIWNQDPINAGKLTSQFQALQAQRQTLAGEIQGKQQKLHFEAQQSYAKREEESRAYLQREIPEWSPDLDVKLSKFAIDQGFTADQIKGLAVNSPQSVKILHLAFVGKQLMDKQRAAAKPKPQPAQPVPQVKSSRSNTTKSPADMSVEEMAKHLKLGSGGR
jgi:hypothetical protein